LIKGSKSLIQCREIKGFRTGGRKRKRGTGEKESVGKTWVNDIQIYLEGNILESLLYGG
jgi:hypothetical protein